MPASSFPLAEQSNQSCTSKELVSFPDFPDLNVDDFMNGLDTNLFHEGFASRLDMSASRTMSINQIDDISEHNKLSSRTSISTSLFMNPMQKRPLLCGFQRCSFEGPDWGAMVSHRRKEHSQHGDFKCRYHCTICNKYFFHKSNLVRHSRACGGRSFFYCPDCPTWAPLQRVDNYIRHRKTRHSDKDGVIKPYSKSPPPGYRRPSRQKDRFVMSIIDEDG